MGFAIDVENQPALAQTLEFDLRTEPGRGDGAVEDERLEPRLAAERDPAVVNRAGLLAGPFAERPNAWSKTPRVRSGARPRRPKNFRRAEHIPIHEHKRREERQVCSLKIDKGPRTTLEVFRISF